MGKDETTLPEMADSPLKIDMQPKDLGSDFQNKITDAESLDLAFKGELCGWRIVSESTKEKTITGKEKIVTKQKLEIDREGRIMNEQGANFVFKSVVPLISALTTTSSFDNADIYNQYRARLKSIKFTLLDSIVLDENPYDIIPYRVHEIISFLCSCYLITKKGHKGFTLKELAETFITSIMSRTMPELKSQQGFLDKIRSGFSGGK
jgi:hypothetical protein